MRLEFCLLPLVVLQVVIAISNLDTNVCMDAKLHLEAPTPIPNLYNHCSPWAELSCCSNETAFDAHNTLSKNYNFNYSHCKNISSECMKYFTKNHCFYECSPNLGPWLITTRSKYRKEKISNVPLCASDCNNWWKACQSEMTCVENWSKDFDFSTGTNLCPNSTECQSFSQVFKNSTYFCENVFRGDFKVTADKKPCMKMWFNTTNNPNEKVSKYYAALLSSVHITVTQPYTNSSKNIPVTGNDDVITPLLSRTGTTVTIVFAVIFILLSLACVVYHLYYKYRKGAVHHGPRHCKFLRCLLGGSTEDYRRTNSDENVFIDYEDDVIDDDDDDLVAQPHGTLQMEL